MNVEAAEQQLVKLFDIARKVGIYHAMFINFGTLLGYVRENGLIAHDDDTDISIRSDWITRRQEQDFYDELTKQDMFLYRARKAFRPTSNGEGRFLWLSLKMASPGTKSCCWFMFPWKSHLYHCKGKRWLRKIGLKPAVRKLLPKNGEGLAQYQSIMKGNSLHCFDKLKEVRFLGTRVNIPYRAGTLLDEFYPDWAVPGKGSSARFRSVLIRDWMDESSWLVLE